MPLKPALVTYRSLPRIASQTRTHKHAIFAAPNKGLDISRPLVAQDPLTASQLVNWWTRKWGPELRAGYKRWTTNLGGVGTEAEVRTVMAYHSPPGSAGSAEPHLFAACNDDNIYDITDQSDEVTTPAADQNVPGQSVSGRFSHINFSVGGTNYLCTVSAGGGYWTFDDAGGWVDRTANITGVSALTFDFITVWKNRIWFVCKDTAEAWFLPVDVIQGAATKVDFGPLFSHGGFLSVITSWTMDAGDGIDDRMVVIASEGDVLLYAGTDPTSADTFAMVGRWYVGKVPAGRRYASQYGGDVAIITEAGVEYLSHLLQGRGLHTPEGQLRDDPAYRFNEAIAEEVRDSRGESGWAIIYHAGQEAAIISTPNVLEVDSLQFVLGANSLGWSTFEGLPINCYEVFEGHMYFGTVDGKIGQAFTANSDDELSDGTAGRTITGEVQTAYVTDPDNPMTLKRMLLIQPMFQAPSPPSVQARINTEWAHGGTPGAPSFAGAEGSLWNTGLWNTAIWGTAQQAYFSWLGANGTGAYASLRMAVQGLPGTIFTSWKLVYEPGGIM